jgi:hypothetical protein
MGKPMTTEDKRWLKVMAQREITSSRNNPLSGEFFLNSVDPDGYKERVECLTLVEALHCLDGMLFEQDPYMGCISNAWGDAAKGILNHR